MKKILIICLILLTDGFMYAQKKILIVGDSWAETIWRTNAFDPVLQEYGFPAGLTEGGEGDKKEGTLIAIGGSRADQWAQNHLDWQGRIKSLITENPSVSIIHLIIGGNDFLNIVSKSNVMELSPAMRDRQWEVIKNNIRQLVDYCLGLKPDLKVLICDYDYLNIQNARKIYGYDFGGMNQAQLNQAFRELGLKKKEIAEESERCFYIENWGVLNEYYKRQQGICPSEGTDSLNIYLPEKADIGDGIHINIEAHQVILRRAVTLFYLKFLKSDTQK